MRLYASTRSAFARHIKCFAKTEPNSAVEQGAKVGSGFPPGSIWPSSLSTRPEREIRIDYWPIMRHHPANPSFLLFGYKQWCSSMQRSRLSTTVSDALHAAQPIVSLVYASPLLSLRLHILDLGDPIKVPY